MGKSSNQRAMQGRKGRKKWKIKKSERRKQMLSVPAKTGILPNANDEVML